MSKKLLVMVESEFTMQGTLTIPTYYSETYPAIILIGDRGKFDRDGNKGSLKVNLYRELANYFTSLGFAVLRYDKRGTYKSKGNYCKASVTDFIDDATLWVRFLKEHPQINPKQVIIVGHGEGALLAPAICTKESVAGLVLLAGAAEPSNILLEKQREKGIHELEKMDGFTGWLIKTLKISQYIRTQNEIMKEKVKNPIKFALNIKGVKSPREQLQYNVVTYLEQVSCPVLAITGDKDVQVPPEHAKLIASYVNGEAEWHIIPNMNHILRKYEHKHTMIRLRQEYKSLMDKSIEEELLHVMKEWLKRHYLS
ncbi:alpha/beta hydrolase [Bacillus clarus]|uniref:Alpha/beta hydrolase n=1 Tax=Bacillus clarus TaxID=2338372 RepID=A0A090YKG1_9BACI|nr:alpha/beta hydrolase [Bacillus clarus]KFM98944.1 dienelactone hydrolase family protein [Bacillus clarus]RFT63848.1 alpha/beta hydrolase [Bacillus clarus]